MDKKKDTDGDTATVASTVGNDDPDLKKDDDTKEEKKDDDVKVESKDDHTDTTTTNGKQD